MESVISNGTLFYDGVPKWTRHKEKKEKPKGMIGKNGRPPHRPLGGDGAKGTRFNLVSRSRIKELQNFINSIPRASLKGKSANESFLLGR
jgi:hypothetical protein